MKIKYLLMPFLALALIACSSATVATQVFKNASITGGPQIPVTGVENFRGCAGPVIQTVNPDFEQAVVEQTNEVRMQNGLPPLKRVIQLDESARYHSADMSATDYFSHETLHKINGQLTQVCDTWDRIQAYYTNWQALAENIAAGQSSPEMAMDGWMHSPDHRHNILSDSYWEIGVGYFEGSGEYRYYWDQNFGRRDGIFPLVLDGEKAKTTSQVVPVYIYGNFDQMRLRIDNGEWSSWRPFEHSFNWTLPDIPGKHTVTAELRGEDGHTTTSDSIQLIP